MRVRLRLAVECCLGNDQADKPVGAYCACGSPVLDMNRGGAIALRGLSSAEDVVAPEDCNE